MPARSLGQAVGGMFAYPFMVTALAAGTIVAVVAGVIGWFMVFKRQSFAGHALAVVGFPGAAGAVLLGVAAAYGYLTFCIGAALVIAMLPSGQTRGRTEESAVTGTVQAFALACGFLFVSLYHGFLTGINALLFGSIVGITSGQVLLLLVVGVATLAVLAVIGRPLLFASVDPAVAGARAVPVRALSVIFLVLLGAAVAEASQITGTLLVYALLVAPPATAQLLTSRPALGLALSPLIGLAVTWIGLSLAFYWPYPAGFFITMLAFAGYVAARLMRSRQVRRSLSASVG